MSLYVTQHGLVRRQRMPKLSPPAVEPCRKGHRAEKYRGVCIECRRLYQREWRKENRDHIIEYKRAYRAERRSRNV